MDLYNCADSGTVPDIINYIKSLPPQASADQRLLLAELNDFYITLFKKHDPTGASAILKSVEGNETLLARIPGEAQTGTPMEVSDAEYVLQAYVYPATGKMPDMNEQRSRLRNL